VRRPGEKIKHFGSFSRTHYILFALFLGTKTETDHNSMLDNQSHQGKKFDVSVALYQPGCCEDNKRFSAAEQGI
jgi:hypothetical protein